MKQTNIYKIEIMVIDFEHDGIEAIKDELENNRFINASVKGHKVKAVNWSDDHPLNKCGTSERAYLNLFSGGES